MKPSAKRSCSVLVGALLLCVAAQDARAQEQSTATRKAQEGVKLVLANEFASGWTLLEQARKEAPEHEGVALAHEGMAFRILMKVVEREKRPEGIDVGRLMEVLVPHTADGVISDPVMKRMRREKKMIIVDQARTTISLDEAKRARAFPVEKPPPKETALKAVLHGQPPDLAGQLDNRSYYGNFYYFEGKEQAESGYRKLLERAGKLKTTYPFVVELYFVPEEHRFVSDYVVIVTVAMAHLDDLLKNSLDNLDLDIGQRSFEHFNGRNTDSLRARYSFEKGVTFSPTGK